MHIVFHVGAHCTDQGQLQKVMVKNRSALEKEGIIIPFMGRFRPILRETNAVLDGAKATPEVRQALLDTLVEGGEPERLVLSWEHFICGPRRAMTEDGLYPDATNAMRKLANIFPDDQIEFCMAIRNPATFLPAIFRQLGADDFEAYVAQCDVANLRWSDLAARIQSELPDVALKMWSNEDTPFIWRELVEEVTGHNSFTLLKGLDDYLGAIISRPGMRRMGGYLKTHPPANEIQRRRIVSAFLEKFPSDEDDQSGNLPGWSEEYMQDLTEAYEDDLYRIEKLPNVDFLSP